MANSKRYGGEGREGTNEKTRPKLRSSHGGAPRAARGPTKRTARTARNGAGLDHLGPRTRKARGPSPGAHLAQARPPARPGESAASEAARGLAIAVAIAALEKKAESLEILDVAGKVDYADFLVIMTGRSDRHVQSLSQGIEEAMRKKGVRPMAVEGLPVASWVLMDFGDVVVHVFQDESRSLYDIEGLWLDARRMPLPSDEPT
jgi:ribosome-associated protein